MPNGSQNSILERIRSIPPYKRNRIIAATIAGILILLVLLGLFGVFAEEEERTSTPIQEEDVTLTVWDPFDSRNAYQELIRKYESQNSNVEIEYKSRPFGSYRDDLTSALASDRGPEIYTILGHWMPLERDRIAPLNDVFSGVDTAALISNFADAARFDLTRSGEESGEPIVYSLPMSLDTLALYYNRSHFNSANILNPPETWQEFIEVVKKLRRRDGDNIQLAGAAIGSADNVNQASDILAALMLQSGAKMNSEDGRVTFDSFVEKDGEEFFPAHEAIRLYTSFANPASENYTWDRNGPHSVDAFTGGTASMMIDYSFQRDVVKDKNPHLEFAIAELPQPEDQFDKINYASIIGPVVSKRASDAEQAAAWDFIRFLTKEENAKIYASETKRPVALKSLLEWQRENSGELRPFVDQVLSARSWIQPNAFRAEAELNDAIRKVLDGEDVRTVINNAAQNINISESEF